MYNWRQMTPDERQAALQSRRAGRVPWHAPPHYQAECGHYLVTAACYEHRHWIGTTPDRMAQFESDLLATLAPHCVQVFAWVVLPNHYHALLHARELNALLAAIGRLHGRTSFIWNGEDKCRGRHVWHRVVETGIKSEGHFWASMNYVLHNAVRHGYAQRWEDWPYCNAAEYLADVGREMAERRWRSYPVYDYGKDWDPPEL
jgi:putative transposase